MRWLLTDLRWRCQCARHAATQSENQGRRSMAGDHRRAAKGEAGKIEGALLFGRILTVSTSARTSGGSALWERDGGGDSVQVAIARRRCG